MLRVPLELIGMLVLLAIGAAYCTFAIRDDFRRDDGTMDRWGIVEGLASLFFILAMLVSAALQVAVRYAFSDDVDLPWTEEFGRLALVWAAFWGAAVLQRVDDHIRMTVVYDLMRPSMQWLLRIIGDVVTIVILLPLVWLGWETARGLDIMHTIALGMPLSTFAYPVPIAGLLMLAHTVALLARRLTGRELGPAVGTPIRS
ncbi:MAG: TRAP transporter small permease [Burkholderiales bacterium]